MIRCNTLNALYITLIEKKKRNVYFIIQARRWAGGINTVYAIALDNRRYLKYITVVKTTTQFYFYNKKKKNVYYYRIIVTRIKDGPQNGTTDLSIRTSRSDPFTDLPRGPSLTGARDSVLLKYRAVLNENRIYLHTHTHTYKNYKI